MQQQQLRSNDVINCSLQWKIQVEDNKWLNESSFWLMHFGSSICFQVNFDQTNGGMAFKLKSMQMCESALQRTTWMRIAQQIASSI